MTNEVGSKVHSTKDEVLNLKDVLIKTLQEENNLLYDRCAKLEKKVVSLESSINHLEQYGRRNKVVIPGNPHDICDNDLFDTVLSILNYVDVNIV